MRFSLTALAIAVLAIPSLALAGSSLPMFQDDAWVTASDGVYVVHALKGSGDGVEQIADASLIASNADLAAANGGTADQVLSIAVRERLSTDGTQVVADAYAASSSAYSLGGPGGGTGFVYKIDGESGAVSVCAALPQGSLGAGLGGIDYNAVHDVFYVANVFDGRIYTLAADCSVQGILDPFAPSFIHGAAPIAPVSAQLRERFEGLGYNAADNRLYGFRWAVDQTRVGKGSWSQVYSFCVDPAGTAIACTGGPPFRLEITVEHGPFGAYSSPGLTITFDSTGTRMYIAERAWQGDWSLSSGVSQLREYIGSTADIFVPGSGWGPGSPGQAPSGASYDVGPGAGGWCAGGADLDSAENVGTTADLLATVNGVQLLSSGGGTAATSDLLALGVEEMGALAYCTGCPEHPVAPESGGCTYTQGYWKNHNAYRSNNNQNSPWPISEDTLLCGETWLDNLNESTRGRPFYILSHQWIAASLNVANGAAPPSEVSDALAEGEDLLNDNCADRDNRRLADRARMIELADLLDQFNNGIIGPGHCDDDGCDDESSASSSGSSVSGSSGSGSSGSATGSSGTNSATRSGSASGSGSSATAPTAGSASRSGDSASAATRSSSGGSGSSGSASSAGSDSSDRSGSGGSASGSSSGSGSLDDDCPDDESSASSTGSGSGSVSSGSGSSSSSGTGSSRAADRSGPNGGASCASTGSASTSGLALLALLLGVGVRRRMTL